MSMGVVKVHQFRKNNLQKQIFSALKEYVYCNVNWQALFGKRNCFQGLKLNSACNGLIIICNWTIN